MPSTAVLGMQLVIFCQILVMFYVNFDVCSIAFVVYLLNGVPFSIFVLIREFCTPLSLVGFPNATTLLFLSFQYWIALPILELIYCFVETYVKHFSISDQIWLPIFGHFLKFFLIYEFYFWLISPPK